MSQELLVTAATWPRYATLPCQALVPRPLFLRWPSHLLTLMFKDQWDLRHIYRKLLQVFFFLSLRIDSERGV